MRPVRYPASRRVKDRRKASYALLSKISKDLEFLKERAIAMDAAEQKTTRRRIVCQGLSHDSCRNSEAK